MFYRCRNSKTVSGTSTESQQPHLLDTGNSKANIARTKNYMTYRSKWVVQTVRILLVLPLQYICHVWGCLICKLFDLCLPVVLAVSSFLSAVVFCPYFRAKPRRMSQSPKPWCWSDYDSPFLWTSQLTSPRNRDMCRSLLIEVIGSK
jgi:hypothetical protein